MCQRASLGTCRHRSPSGVGRGVTPRATEGKMTFMATRYDMQEDDEGWTVFDIWTGWPAVIKGAKQVGLEIQDADDLVDLLNYMNERREPLP